MATATFYLFANVNFVPDRYAEWQAAYNDLAVYVYPNEPNCMTYYFGVPLEYASDMAKTTHMFAFEAYGKREDLYVTHFSSEAMKVFLTKIPECMTTGLDLRHFAPRGGFLDRDGDMAECGLMQDTRIRCKDAESRGRVVERLSRLAGEVEATEREKESGVLTFMGFEGLDDEINARIFARFADREAMERFLRRKDVLAFWFASKDDIEQMEWRNYAPNGKGWLHR